MIQFEKYVIKFYYPDKKDSKKQTICIVEKTRGRLLSKVLKPKTIGLGKAICSRNDNFCREKGRKLAMLRAMKNAEFSKTQRQLVWEMYRSMKLGGRW